jgi:virulence-associated protein VagC
MAGDIDKGLYSAPQGLEELAAALPEPDIEIEIEDPESVEISADGMTVVIEPESEYDDEFNANLAEEMSEGALTELSGDLLGDFTSDTDSRKDWLNTYVDGIDLLGLKIEDRTEPWPGACAVYHPLLAEALVKFQAETMMETFPASGPVKTQIIGKVTPEKEDAAERVKEDMNFELTEGMPEYRPEHERMLWGLGLSGNAFKKVYYDPSLERQVSLYVPAEDIVVPYGASSLQTAPRVTHVMRKTENELRKLQVAGFYRDIDLGEPSHVLDEVEKRIAEKMGFNATMDDRFHILEMHVDIDLPGYEDEDDDGEPTGIALPYVVTLERGTGEVLAIRRNWNPDDKTKQKRQHFVHYGYIPSFGFYHLGLIHLIGASVKAATMLQRQLVDAGTLSNLPGGFKTRGLRIKGDDTPIAPAEFRDVDVPSGAIRDNIMPLPYKEPSQVLNALMIQIIEEAKAFANAADMQVSDMSANSPVGTTLAILERTLKVSSAVQARIYYAMKQEFKLLAGIIRDYTPEEYSYEPVEGNARAKQSDYDNVDVIPVADPNASTMAQKVVQYQAVMQMAQGNPDIYDMVELNKQMLEILNIKNIGKLIPAADDDTPRDPVSENMNLINGKPAKAFMHQDHEAHIQVHMAAMQDPKIAAMIGQSPNAQAVQAAFAAHVTEHIAFAYRRGIEEQLGTGLPPVDEKLDGQVEVQLSRLVAQAAQQLLQKNQAEQQQQEAQQQAQDPMIQMQQKELELKAQEIQIKAQKAQADIEVDKAKIQVDIMRIQSEERKTGAQIGVKTMSEKAKMEQDAMKFEQQQQAEGVRIGADMAKTKAQQAMQREQAEKQHNLSMNQIMQQKAQKSEKPKEE